MDHTGCGKWLVQQYGVETCLSQVDDCFWRDCPAKPGRPETWKDYEITHYLQDGERVTLGEKEIEVVSTPGHTPGCLSYLFDVTENGKAYKAALWGGTTPPRTAALVPQYLQSLRRFTALAKRRGVTVALCNHTAIDSGLQRIAYAQKRLAYLPNIYIVGEEGFLRYCEVFSAMHIKTPGQKTQIRSLSGGNQQKVIIGRWLLTQPDFIILDEPTRGIDVGTKTEIQKLVLQLADKGTSVMFISSEIDEMLRTCDHMLPSWALALSWNVLFRNTRIGGVPGFLCYLGLDIPDWLAYGPVPIIAVLSIHYYAYSYLLVSAALRSINSEVEEMGEVIGASKTQILRRITFPLVLPAILSALILTFSKAIGTYGVPSMLGLKVGYYTIPTMIHSTVTSSQSGMRRLVFGISAPMGRCVPVKRAGKPHSAWRVSSLD